MLAEQLAQHFVCLLGAHTPALVVSAASERMVARGLQQLGSLTLVIVGCILKADHRTLLSASHFSRCFISTSFQFIR